MTKTDISTPEAKVIEFIDYLKESGVVRFKAEIYEKTGITRQYYTSIKRGEAKRFTSTQIQSLCEHYKINANWIFGVSEKMLRG